MSGNNTAKADIATTSFGDSFKVDKKKKSIMPRLFGSKKYSREGSDYDSKYSENIATTKAATWDASSKVKQSLLESHSSVGIEGLNLSNFEQTMSSENQIQDFRIYAGTWNVGGKAPDHCLNLQDFLQVEGSADIYVLGFQEIVPLSAGNVLVAEDNEPAAKWLALINQALNKPTYQHTINIYPESGSSSSKQSKDPKSNFFHKQSLKDLSKSLKADTTLLKACNCNNLESSKRKPRKLINETMSSFSGPLVGECFERTKNPTARTSYSLIASKQMVGIFLTVWAKKEIVEDIGHLRICCVGRGIMGYLGNKGCISVSFSLHQTSFCFVCSHLASGEKEGDEIKRNADVSEIIKSTQFNKICKSSTPKIPERIIDHDRVIWLGDLNYRVSLSYEETKSYIERSDWDPLLEKDQLITEREAGRVFCGFMEGKILFAPTYKYSKNSDSYAAGETVKLKKRRTPAWCDRILWHGSGIEQLSYIRGESRLSDHRPVCAVFAVEVEKKRINTARFRKGYSIATRFGYEDSVPQRHSFYD